MSDLLSNLKEGYLSSMGFVRDILQYGIPGFLFLLVCYNLFPPTLNGKVFIDAVSLILNQNNAYEVIGIILLSYGVGMFLNSITYPIFPLLDILFGRLLKCKLMTSYENVEKQKNELAKLLIQKMNIDSSLKNIFEENIEIYVVSKIFTFLPSYYKLTYERYNAIIMYESSIAGLLFTIIIMAIILNSILSSTILILAGSILFLFTYFIYWVSVNDQQNYLLTYYMMIYNGDFQQSTIIK